MREKTKGAPRAERPNEGAASAVANAVREFLDGPPRSPHITLVGGFGSGKSYAIKTGLERALAGADPRAVRVAHIPLGGSSIASLVDLLYEIVLLLGPTIFSALESARDLRTQALRAKKGDSGEDNLLAVEARGRLIDLALSELTGGRPLILVIENLDQVIDQLSDSEQVELQTLLTRTPGKMLSPLLLVASSSRELLEPWASAFTSVELVPVTPQQAIDWLRRIAGNDPLKMARLPFLFERLAYVNPLAQGNPRFWELASTHMFDSVDKPIERTLNAWHKLLDAYYPERLRWLAPSERRIILELARAGRPQRVVDLADLVGATPPSTASSLSRLFDAGWVKRRSTIPGASKRVTWYDLVDPLLRSHLENEEHAGPTSLASRAYTYYWYSRAEQPAPGGTVHSLAEYERQGDELRDGGQPRAASAIFLNSLVAHVTTQGLTSPDALRALVRYAEAIGRAGDRDQAIGLLTLATADSRGVFGNTGKITSAPALYYEAQLSLAWFFLENGNAKEAIRRYSEVISAISHRRELLVMHLTARQDLARAVGEGGDPNLAVDEFGKVMQTRHRILETDTTLTEEEREGIRDAVRTCAHGLAWWMGEAGKPFEAVRLFDEMAADAKGVATPWEIYSYRLDAARWQYRMEPLEGIERALALATDSEAFLQQPEHAAAARRQALDWALEVGPSATSIPIASVPPDDLAVRLASSLARGDLSPSDLEIAMARASEPQIDAVVIACVFGPGTPLETRSRIARSFGKRMSPTVAPVMTAFGDALNNDPDAESELPQEWLELLEAIREEAAVRQEP